MQYQAIKVFTATKAKERESLSEAVNAWLSKNQDLIEIINTEVRQSSDEAFHCLTIVIFYNRLSPLASDA
jgi:hypothetical protein